MPTWPRIYLRRKMSAQATRRKVNVTQVSASLWKRRLAFLFGFLLQFNILIGGGGEGAAATGGYGFRVFDFLTVVAVALLVIHALSPRRIFALTVFSAIVAAMAVLRMQEPGFWSDPRTVTLAVHYLAYGYSGLYLALICNEDFVVRGYCWGLIVGLVATLPIFAFQELGYSSNLVEIGLVPGYHADVDFSGDVARYSGLWGHPNQAGHIAALTGAAGAYFAFCRRFTPAAVVAAALVAIFYFTESRGGLIAGGSVLAISMLYGRRQEIDFLRIIAVAIALVIAVALLLQIDFIAYRFEGDPLAGDNFSERLGSTLAGIQLALSNPFGLSLDIYSSEISAATGGVGSPHNGFITFAIILGVVPLLVLIAAFVANLRIRGTDAFFFFLTVQVSISFMFEQLPADGNYAFIICLLLGRAFLRTRVGSELTQQPVRSATPAFGRRIERQSNI
jgi:hypothetical protein